MTRNAFLERCLEISRNNMHLRQGLAAAAVELGRMTKAVNRMMLVALTGWGLAIALLIGWCP